MKPVYFYPQSRCFFLYHKAQEYVCSLLLWVITWGYHFSNSTILRAILLLVLEGFWLKCLLILSSQDVWLMCLYLFEALSYLRGWLDNWNNSGIIKMIDFVFLDYCPRPFERHLNAGIIYKGFLKTKGEIFPDL